MASKKESLKEIQKQKQDQTLRARGQVVREDGQQGWKTVVPKKKAPASQLKQPRKGGTGGGGGGGAKSGDVSGDASERMVYPYFQSAELPKTDIAHFYIHNPDWKKGRQDYDKFIKTLKSIVPQSLIESLKPDYASAKEEAERTFIDVIHLLKQPNIHFDEKIDTADVYLIDGMNIFITALEKMHRLRWSDLNVIQKKRHLSGFCDIIQDNWRKTLISLIKDCIPYINLDIVDLSTGRTRPVVFIWSLPVFDCKDVCSVECLDQNTIIIHNACSLPRGNCVDDKTLYGLFFHLAKRQLLNRHGQTVSQPNSITIVSYDYGADWQFPNKEFVSGIAESVMRVKGEDYRKTPRVYTNLNIHLQQLFDHRQQQKRAQEEQRARRQQQRLAQEARRQQQRRAREEQEARRRQLRVAAYESPHKDIDGFYGVFDMSQLKTQYRRVNGQRHDAKVTLNRKELIQALLNANYGNLFYGGATTKVGGEIPYYIKAMKAYIKKNGLTKNRQNEQLVRSEFPKAGHIKAVMDKIWMP